MNFDIAIPIIGPVVLIVNIATMFLCFRPKRGVLCTIVILAIYGTVVHFFVNPLIIQTFLAPYGGVIIIPIMVWLFRGQIFQKIFANFMAYQFTFALTSIVEALVGSLPEQQSAYATTYFFVLSVILLGIYMTLVLRFGKRFLERVLVDNRQSIWIMYSLGAVLSFIISATLRWQIIGAGLYIALLLFILWSFVVLCYMIINTHEKAAQKHNTETMALQMNAMREQMDSEKKHRKDMEILRHDMRHEMSVIMELYRTGKSDQAEAMYADWQTALNEAVPALLCAEPILNAVLTRFELRAKDTNIRLYVKSNIPGTLPVDTIKLSVMAANALENALTATEKVREDSKRVIRIKLLKIGQQIGLEIVNPCSAPVKFDEKGLPVTHELGHGIGVRSIAAFAETNDYLLDFSYVENKFTLRLVMDV